MNTFHPGKSRTKERKRYAARMGTVPVVCMTRHETTLKSEREDDKAVSA